MKYIEYGKHCLDTIILLHGGGLSWWTYEDVANALQNDYHIILPILKVKQFIFIQMMPVLINFMKEEDLKK